jgi:dienelactone hydrolase
MFFAACGAGRAEPAASHQVIVAPNAAHEFDRANFPLHAVAGADAGAPERGHLGGDSDARADTQRRVAEWLSR